MEPLRRIAPLLMAAMAAVVLSSGCSSADTASPTTSSGASAPIAWEAVLRAGSAAVIDAPAASGSADQIVQLRDLDDTVVIFSDRPTRREGEMPVDEFVALWHTGAFGADPPNAAVLIDGQVRTVELTGAALDADDATMALSVGRLDDDPDGLPVGEHDAVTMFVDSFAADVVSGQVTDAVTQTNVKVIGEPPATSMGHLYQTLATSPGMANQVSAESDPGAVPRSAYEADVDPMSGADAGSATDEAPSFALGPTRQQAQILGL